MLGTYTDVCLRVTFPIVLFYSQPPSPAVPPPLSPANDSISSSRQLGRYYTTVGTTRIRSRAVILFFILFTSSHRYAIIRRGRGVSVCVEVKVLSPRTMLAGLESRLRSTRSAEEIMGKPEPREIGYKRTLVIYGTAAAGHTATVISRITFRRPASCSIFNRRATTTFDGGGGVPDASISVAPSPRRFRVGQTIFISPFINYYNYYYTDCRVSRALILAVTWERER